MMSRALWRISLAVALPLTVATGCAIVNPYRGADDAAVLSQPTLPHAVEYAAKTRQQYYDGISEHTLFNRTLGVVITGVAAAAAGVGITGGPADAIAGLALGGAGLFGVNRVLYSEQRLRVYAEGARALTCSIAVFAPLRAVQSDQLRVATGTLRAGLAALQREIAVMATFGRNAEEDDRVTNGREVARAAGETLHRADETLSAVATAGVRLYDATERVRSQVTKALLQSEPDLSEIVASASQSIRTNAALLAGAPAPPAETTVQKSALDNRAAESHANEIERLSRQVEDARLEVEALLAALGSLPTAEQLEGCAIDENATGLSFFVDPTSVVVDPKATDRSAVLIIRGGKPPYHAQWTGRQPGDDVALGSVDHGEGGRQASVSVTASASARPDTYRLLVTDEGAGRVVVPVTVAGGALSGGGGRHGGAARVPDPAVHGIQSDLVSLGCLNATTETGSSTIDGEWGRRTTEAVERLLDASEVAASDRAKYREGAPHRVANVRTAIADAKAGGVRCGAPPAATPTTPASPTTSTTSTTSPRR